MAVSVRKSLLFTMISIVAVIGILVVLILTFDWNLARGYVNRTASDMLGRDVEIRGDLHMQLVSGAPDESGWQHYLKALPILKISADDVQISNPSWSEVGNQMATAHRVVVLLRPFALLRRQAIITELDLDAPMLALQRRSDGSNTWSLRDSGQPTWDVKIQRLIFDNGTVRYLDSAINLDMHAEVNSVAGAFSDTAPTLAPTVAGTSVATAGSNPAPVQQFDLKFVVGGSYKHAPVIGTGRMGSLLSIDNQDAVFPVQADLKIGENRIAWNGVVTDPRAPDGINVSLTLAGASLSDLYPLIGVLLPQTPAYKTSGHLLGQKKEGNWNWAYQNFNGTIGGSDLEGSLNYSYQQPRPLLRGTLKSRLLRLEDLSPVVGADSNAQKVARGKAPVQPEGKVLPVEQFQTQHWDALDADVKFTGDHLIRTHNIPLDHISANIHLTDRKLSFEPLYFSMAGGDVTSNLILDGSKQKIDAQIKLAARNLKLNQLFPTLHSMRGSLGEVNGDAALTGHGNSVSALLATSNGELAATVSPGSISRYVLEEAGLNVANVIFVKLFGDKQVRLNCLVSDYGVKDGVAKVRRFIIDTDDAVIGITGDVDLVNEQLDLNVQPDSKGLRIFSFRTPLYAKGSFEHPDVGPYKGPLVLRATAALALGALAPPAAALATLQLGTVPAIDCAAELSKAMQTRRFAKSEPTAAPAKQVTSAEIQQSRVKK